MCINSIPNWAPIELVFGYRVPENPTTHEKASKIRLRQDRSEAIRFSKHKDVWKVIAFLRSLLRKSENPLLKTNIENVCGYWLLNKNILSSYLIVKGHPFLGQICLGIRITPKFQCVDNKKNARFVIFFALCSWSTKYEIYQEGRI